MTGRHENRMDTQFIAWHICEFGMRMKCVITFQHEPPEQWFGEFRTRIDSHPTETEIYPKMMVLYRDRFREGFSDLIESSIEYANQICELFPE